MQSTVTYAVLTYADHGYSHDTLQACLEDEMPSVKWLVREPQPGEPEGTYLMRPDGNLDLLGYSVAIPEDILEALDAAFERALCEEQNTIQDTLHGRPL